MPSFGPCRTLVLTERITRTIRLTPADIDFLLVHHRGHFEILPTTERHCYRLTSLGRVGVVVAPTCRLVIRPKIPLQNLFLLLDPTTAVAAADDASTPRAAEEMLDFLTGQLVHRMRERIAAGLHRAYREQSVQGPTLHGALDLSAQMRDGAARKERLHGRLDELSVDVPCNQAVRATADRLLACSLLGEEVRQALTAALRAFADVTSLPLGPERFAQAEADRRIAGYRPLLGLCQLLAEGLAPGEQAGSFAGPAFLLDLERAFERYLTRGIREAFSETEMVAVQPWHRIGATKPGAPEIALRPDIILYHAGRPVIAVDAKWKRPPRSNLDIGDLHQALAYGAALDLRRMVLVYPGRRDREWTYPIHSTFAVQVRTLRVVGSAEACRDSLRRLGHTLRRGNKLTP
jgi:5-methylcytosine-specific restriction enzyme subunit McrC